MELTGMRRYILVSHDFLSFSCCDTRPRSPQLILVSLDLSPMVTLRTYSNPAEAAMAKSLLDNHKIICSLADENVNLYGGGPLAMPIRLLVAEEQAEEASRILKTKAPELPEDFDSGPGAEAPE